MADAQIRLRVNVASLEEARSIEANVGKCGGLAEISQQKGLLPLMVVLAIVIPPGVGLLALVIDRIVHGWRDHGVLIDARGTGAPTIINDSSLPYGTVIILTRDGQKSKRTDLKDIDLSKYIGEAIKALNSGASAEAAEKAAASSIAA